MAAAAAVLVLTAGGVIAAMAGSGPAIGARTAFVAGTPEAGGPAGWM